MARRTNPNFAGQVEPPRRPAPWFKSWRRVADIVTALMALTVLALPFLVIAVVLRCTGEGKVWFLQKRIGKDGRLFKVYKFATMRADSERIGTKDITLRDDPRVLPVGRFLRKMKINELPQLINVLKGEMSMIGWRPLLEKSFSYYPPHVQERIIHYKPGLTGIGSVMFRDEEAIVARSDKSPERVYQEDIAPYKGELELWYQANQGIALDFKIIVATAWAVLLPNSRGYLKWFSDLPPRPPALLDQARPQEPGADPT